MSIEVKLSEKEKELTGLRAAVLKERDSDADSVLETIPKQSEGELQ